LAIFRELSLACLAYVSTDMLEIPQNTRYLSPEEKEKCTCLDATITPTANNFIPF
jgi:hypothetical protein